MKTPKRRRKENKTDYSKRIKLLKSRNPRLIFRKTNRYVIVQYIKSIEAQDTVIMGITSKDLMKYSWPKKLEGSLKSIPASYLTGLLIGRKITKENLKTPIVDFGMIRNIKKTRAYAFLKGIIDSGVKIKYKEKIFPEEDRIKGKHMKKDFSKIFEEIKSNIIKDDRRN